MDARQAGDLVEIDQLTQRYFRSMDTWDYDLLETVFTEDAALHYDALQGAQTTYREMIPIFRRFNRNFSFMQHIGGQLVVEISGDAARSTSTLRALHVQTTLEGGDNEWVIYGIYRDRLVRTPRGWRITERHFRQTRTVGSLLPFDRVKSYDTPPWL